MLLEDKNNFVYHIIQNLSYIPGCGHSLRDSNPEKRQTGRLYFKVIIQMKTLLDPLPAEVFLGNKVVFAFISSIRTTRTWKHFPCYWHFVRGTSSHRWIPLTKSQLCGTWFFFQMIMILDKSADIMMTSSNRNIFHVTGPLCGEFTGHLWIPRTKASDAKLWCFLESAYE